MCACWQGVDSGEGGRSVRLNFSEEAIAKYYLREHKRVMKKDGGKKEVRRECAKTQKQDSTAHSHRTK